MQLHSELTIRIDWSELDLFGHVNNVSYYKYLQAARVNTWELCGINKLHQNEKLGPMLASCKCDFKAPLFFPGTIKIVTSLYFIKTTSFGFLHKMYNDKNVLVAEGEDVMVMFDFNKNNKIEIPDAINKNLRLLN